VSAPSIPGLLSLEPGADAGHLLSSLTLGTEVEVQLGSALQARALFAVFLLRFCAPLMRAPRSRCARQRYAAALPAHPQIPDPS
jgi:hypothetical protein